MANPSAVHMGACDLTLGGIGLGYTAGGVKVAYAATTVEINVDQEDSPIDEIVTKQTFEVTVPMSEYQLARFATILPGATLVVNAFKYRGFYSATAAPAYADGDAVFYQDRIIQKKAAGTGLDPTLFPATSGWAELPANTKVKMTLSGAAGASLRALALPLVLTPRGGTSNDAITVFLAVPKPNLSFGFDKTNPRSYSIVFTALKDTVNGLVQFGDSSATASA